MSMFCTFSLGSLSMVLALTKAKMTQWNITTIMVGIAMSSMNIGMAISGLIAAYSVDKISKKPVAIVGGLLTGSSFLLLVVAWSWEVFYLATVLTGVGNGIVAPVIFAIISDATPPEKRASNYGLFFLFGLAGTIYFMIFFLPQMMIQEDWKTVYAFFATYIIVLALLIIFIKLPSRGEKDRSIQELIESKGIEYDYAINFSDIKDIMKRKSNLWLILNFADAIPNGVNTFLIFWLTEEHHLEYSAALGLFVIIVFVGFLSPVFWGLFMDKLNKNTEDETLKIKLCIYLLIASSPLGIIAVFIPWDATGITDAFGIFALPGFFIVTILIIILFILMPGIKPIWQSTMTEINLPEHRTTSYQIAIFVDYLGTAFGVFVAGYLIVWFAPNGYAAAFIFSGLMGLINIFTWRRALRYYKQDKLDVENILAKRVENLKSF
ncbi:MAG: MFS transporter [Promethearchaeota archaeon]